MKLTFVGGPPRAGTTMLERMLISDATYKRFPECSYITRQIEHYYNIKTFGDSARFSAYCRDGITAARLFRAIVDLMIGQLVSGLEPRPELILKDPELTRFIPALLELYPESNVILVVRDPLDTLASLKMVSMRAGKKWELGQTSVYLFPFYVALHEANEARDSRVTVLRYEDLVRQDTGVIKAIEAVLGRPPRVSCGQVWDVDRSDSFYSSFYEKPITQERVGAHREALGPAEEHAIRADFAGVRHYWGYRD